MKNQLAQAATRWAKRGATLSVLIETLHSCCCVARNATIAKPLPCSAPAYREFDFWLGDWDVFEIGGSTREARATITRVQNDCGLREQYEGADGSSGESLSMYDPSKTEWQQTWFRTQARLSSSTEH